MHLSQRQPLAVLPGVYVGRLHDAKNLPLLHSLDVQNVCIVHTASDSVHTNWNIFPQAFTYFHVDLESREIEKLVETILQLTTIAANTLILFDVGKENEAAFVAVVLAMRRDQIAFEEACELIAVAFPFYLSQNLLELGKPLERSFLSSKASDDMTMNVHAAAPGSSQKRLERDEFDMQSTAKRIRTADDLLQK